MPTQIGFEELPLDNELPNNAPAPVNNKAKEISPNNLFLFIK